jgi:hypothetical protein
MQLSTHIGDGDLGEVTPHVDFHPFNRRDGWTMWRRVTVDGRPGHVERVDGEHIVVQFDDCRWYARVWDDFEEGGQYYDTPWNDVPTFRTHAAAHAAMLKRFPVNPDEPFGDPRYSVSPVTETFPADQVTPTGWQLCWGGIASDERKRGITGRPHPADRALFKLGYSDRRTPRKR